MEVSKGTQEVLTLANVMKINTDSDTLYVEFILYGLISMANGIDDPSYGTGYRTEAKKMRKLLEQEIHDLPGAEKTLQEKANADTSSFHDNPAVLGRAFEIAGDNPVTAVELAKAVLEDSKSTITWLNQGSGMDFDNLNHISGSDFNIKIDPEQERKQREEQERKQREEEERKRREEQERKQREEEERKQKEEAELKAKLEALGLLAALEEFDKQNKKQEENKPKAKWTFIGPFEFRGSTFWGFLQYFLLGILVSGGALFALEHFTHYVTQPPTPWWAFGINVFIAISVYYHLRGLTYLMERKWPAWALFTRQLFDLLLIFMVMLAYVFEFCVPGYFPGWRAYIAGGFRTFKPSPLPYFPRWLKYVGGVPAVLVFSVGTVLYKGLYYPPDVRKRFIRFGKEEGTVGKLIFQTISKSLVLPLAFFVIFWAYDKPLKDWQIKAFWIYGFVSAWILLLNILSIWDNYTHYSWYRGKMRKFTKFLFTSGIFLFIPVLVIFLHWLFGWLPMKLWVKIVLGIYTFICAFLIFVEVYMDKGE